MLGHTTNQKSTKNEGCAFESMITPTKLLSVMIIIIYALENQVGFLVY